MTSLFIDSDILLDVLLKREPFYTSSARVLDLVNYREYGCATSVHSLLNVHYLSKKHVGEKMAGLGIKLLASKIKIVTEDSVMVDKAIQSDFTDFEDAVQYFAAMSITADAIITRNTKDYNKSTIPVFTAEQFLRTLQ